MASPTGFPPNHEGSAMVIPAPGTSTASTASTDSPMLPSAAAAALPDLCGLPEDLSGLCFAVVAPSGFAREPDAVTRAFAALRARGARVHDYSGHDDPDRRFQRFAASDAGRLAQVHDATRDADARVVLALRGGYGLTRILPGMDFPLLADSGKLFVGHSDFTALHMGLLAHGGQGGFAGPMICGDFARAQTSAHTMRHFHECLSGPDYRIAVAGPGNPVVDCQGTLWGGNLAMLCSLVGTPWMPQVDGGILFVEDVGEHPYRIERMLLQLAQAGVLQRQSALLLGQFTSYRLGEFENGYDFDAMLDYLRQELPLPVLTGLPFGHVADKVTLPVGAQARLHCDSSGWELEMSGYRSLSTLA